MSTLDVIQEARAQSPKPMPKSGLLRTEVEPYSQIRRRYQPVCGLNVRWEM